MLLLSFLFSQVSKKHVEEAFKLLNKSIIRVEQPDISFDEEGEEDQEASGVPEDDSELQRDADVVEDDAMNDGDVSTISDKMDEESNIGDSQSVRAGGKKKKLKISYEEYTSMSTILLMYMRREENRGESLGTESEGLKRSKIIDWYLNEISDDIDSEEELFEKKTLVEKVIDRLILVR